jgi:ABC-type transport system involved in multi-copper enzyme maturation permease subunit
VINRGVMLKSARETLPVTLLLGLILLGVQAILAYALPTYSRQFSAQLLRIEFVRSIIQAMLGTELAEGFGAELFVAIPWVHPVTLAIVWAHAIICCTRVPAGEVDRGTIDLLLGLPVSRWSLYLSESLVWAGGAAVLMLLCAAGNALGTWRVTGVTHPSPLRVGIVLVNLLCLYAAVGAAAWLFSALSERRGRAIGAVFVVVAASFLLNYLTQFWEPARRVAFLGMLRYYRPLPILRDGAWPLRDMSALAGAALILWTAAGLVFSRRDLSTL